MNSISTYTRTVRVFKAFKTVSGFSDLSMFLRKCLLTFNSGSRGCISIVSFKKLSKDILNMYDSESPWLKILIFITNYVIQIYIICQIARFPTFKTFKSH